MAKSLPQPRVTKGEGNLHLPVYGGVNPRKILEVPPGSQPAVLLDRDGVLVEDVHYLQEPSELRILAGVPEALRMLQDRYRIIIVTNQSGVARGLFTEDDLLSIHTELVHQLFSKGVLVDGIYFCPHLPEATVPAYQVECECRKPGPGMLLRAAKDWNIDLARSFMVGDSPRDIEAAESAGVKGIMVSQIDTTSSQPEDVAVDLLGAARLILASSSANGGVPKIETVGPRKSRVRQSSRKEVM